MVIDENTGERKRLINEYKRLLKSCRPSIDRAAKREIREAFSMALHAHEGMRRKSGEAYIFHPLEVAIICAREMGLGKTAIICALLHDVVEDTAIGLDQIEAKFGNKVATIIDGLTKISTVVNKKTESNNQNRLPMWDNEVTIEALNGADEDGIGQFDDSLQAENFRRILLTLAEDIRVILVKLADRLHNMRTLEVMQRHSQLKIASETLSIYAPVAHRLGLYNIKSELEDLALKFIQPDDYRSISVKLKETKAKRNKFIKDFIEPIQRDLDFTDLKYEIKGRPKSIYSIYNKMKRQDIPFEEVYDLFAIRIIFDSSVEKEKEICWRIYSIVTEHFTPNSKRTRDWISVPKRNGYESLHLTVMSNTGKWVEIQIRSRRMDEIAEKGYAAHYKYKQGEAVTQQETGVEEWIRQIRDILENTDDNAVEQLDQVKLNFFSDEVFVFTPKGDIKKLPSGSTVLDFAFEVHTEVGSHCMGAKVNHKIVPLNTKLQNGDQVVILTSKKHAPTEDWLRMVTTSKARSSIKQHLSEQKRKSVVDGRELFNKRLARMKIAEPHLYSDAIASRMGYPTSLALFYALGENNIDREAFSEALQSLKTETKTGGVGRQVVTKNATSSNGDASPRLEYTTLPKRVKSDAIVIGEMSDVEYSYAQCCNPIPDDLIFAFNTMTNGVKIHRTNCPEGIRIMSNYGHRVLSARWSGNMLEGVQPFYAGIKLEGIDGLGILNSITDVISKVYQSNIETLNIANKHGAFEGRIILKVSNTQQLESLIRHMEKIEGIQKIKRFEVEESLLET